MKAGDYVAYCIGGNGTSASLAFGKIKRINKLDSRGKPIVNRVFAWDGKTRTVAETPSCTISILPLGVHQGGWLTHGTALKNKTPEKVVRISARTFNKRRKDAVKGLRAIEEELDGA